MPGPGKWVQGDFTLRDRLADPTRGKRLLAMMAESVINGLVNRRHVRTLQAIFADPVNGNIEWRRIEALFLALGAVRTERAGAAVSFALNGAVAQFHRPHPNKAALRYRVKDARGFPEQAGVGP